MVCVWVFHALIESIFLYNSEVWTLTKGLECEIGVFQRKILRYILGIRYSARNIRISNKDLCRIVGLKPWSSVIRLRRLSFFRHVCRLNESTPARIALPKALRPVKRPKRRGKTDLFNQWYLRTYINLIFYWWSFTIGKGPYLLEPTGKNGRRLLIILFYLSISFFVSFHCGIRCVLFQFCMFCINSPTWHIVTFRIVSQTNSL